MRKEKTIYLNIIDLRDNTWGKENIIIGKATSDKDVYRVIFNTIFYYSTGEENNKKEVYQEIVKVDKDTYLFNIKDTLIFCISLKRLTKKQKRCKIKI